MIPLYYCGTWPYPSQVTVDLKPPSNHPDAKGERSAIDGIAELLAVYQLPARLAVTSECLAEPASVRIAGLNGRVILPAVEWTADDHPHIVAPRLSGVPDTVRQRLFMTGAAENDFRFWGLTGTWNSVSKELYDVSVGAVALRFEVGTQSINYVESLDDHGGMAGGAVEALFDQIDRWFEALGVWIRALTNQYVDAAVDASWASTPGHGLKMLAVDGGVVSRVAHASRVNVTIPNRTDPAVLDKRHWLHILCQVNRGCVPPVEYGLIASARTAIRLQQPRKAVIDAGTATELALTHLLESNFHELPQRVQKRLRSNQATLGWIVDIIAKAHDLPTSVIGVRDLLPADLKTGLVKLRNDVVHKNKQPGHNETTTAVGMSAETVKIIQPIPSPPQ